MRAVPAAFLLAVALLAGCFAGPAPPAADPAPAAAPSTNLEPLVWNLTDCEAISWEIPVPASRVAARLPDGFEPTPAADAPMPAGVEQAAVLGFEAVECASAFGSDEQIARSRSFARVYTPVVPPAEQADGRAGTQHAYLYEALIGDDAWRDRLAAQGLPVHDGGTIVGPTAQGFTGRLALDGVGIFSLSGRTNANAQPQADEPFRDFTSHKDGLAAWVGQREEVSFATGLGLWDVSADSWVAEVIGATSGAAMFTIATWTVPHEAVIRPGQGDGQPRPMDD